jgi:hypothetical protein
VQQNRLRCGNHPLVMAVGSDGQAGQVPADGRAGAKLGVNITSKQCVLRLARPANRKHGLFSIGDGRRGNLCDHRSNEDGRVHPRG